MLSMIMDIIDTDSLFQGIAESMNAGLRQVFLSIDGAIYTAFEKVFNLFFEVSKVSFLNGDFYKIIFQRVFFILSVFMLFKLTFNFIYYMISPDAISDPKNPKNLSKLVGRVIVSILFLVILVPIGNDTAFANNSNGVYDSDSYQNNYATDADGNVIDANGNVISDPALYKKNAARRNLTLEENIQNQGILFGLMQTVQNAVLNPENNVIGKLILGNKAKDIVTEDNNSGAAIGTTATAIEMTTFSSFFYVNEKALDYSNVPADADYGICLNNGTNTKVSPTYIVADFDEVNEVAGVKCEKADLYLFKYDVFISTLVGIIITVLTFLFTFDIALRAVKLGILRLISPIPAISYISPKSAQDGAFANYTKMLLNTYVDIFLRIALIYFIILILSNVSAADSEVISYNGAGGFAKVIVIIALLFFATSAPQFIMQALGIKSTGKGLGFGAGLLGGALGGALAGAATGGFAGAAKGLFGGATAGASNFNQAASGQRPNMSARQAALNRGAQLGSGDPNAKGEGLLSNAFGRIGNGMMGINKRKVETGKNSMKNQMYDWQSKAHTAQSDFSNNYGNLKEGTASNGQSWKDYAEDLGNAVLSAQSRVSALENQRESIRTALQNPNLSDADRNNLQRRYHDRESDLVSAKADLAAAQEAQSRGSAEYSDYVRKGAAKAESTYKKASARYQRHGRKDDGLKIVGSSSVGSQRRGPSDPT